MDFLISNRIVVSFAMIINMAIFKKSIAILILVSFVSQTFGSMLVLANYYTNKAAFIQKCINKAKPQLQCNGKCQMMKKMGEQEKKEKDQLEKKSALKQLTLSTKSYYYTYTFTVFTLPVIQIGTETNWLIANIGKSIFHPPSLV